MSYLTHVKNGNPFLVTSAVAKLPLAGISCFTAQTVQCQCPDEIFDAFWPTRDASPRSTDPILGIWEKNRNLEEAATKMTGQAT